MTVDVSEEWLLTAGVTQAAWVWSVNVTIPALGSVHSPVVTPAALVNPYTTVDPNQEASIGHVCHGWLVATGVVAAVVFYQWRTPTGTGTWHNISSRAMPGFQLKDFTLLQVLILPCVPQFRIELNNGGGAFPCPLEGAFTLYGQ